MHDGVAQVLGYVNTKAQATEALLRSGQTDRAIAQLDQLAEASRGAYADVREGILGLRTSLGADRTFIETLLVYLEQWQTQSGVSVTLRTEPEERFAPPSFANWRGAAFAYHPGGPRQRPQAC